MNLISIVIIAAVLLAAELIYFRIADRYDIIDKPNERSSHTKVVLRGGGVIFPIAALVWAIYSLLEGSAGIPTGEVADNAIASLSGNSACRVIAGYLPFLAGLLLVATVSFIDDVKNLPDSIRLGVQFVAMGLMFWSLDLYHPSMWWMVIAGLILCVGIVNAYNFMDGINGITGGYSLSVLLPLLFVDRQFAGSHALRPEGLVGMFIDKELIIVMILALLVFCLFNFRKKARCFAGDVGSVSIAFVIVFALGKLMLWTGDFTYIVFLVVYGVDSVMTILHRIMLQENLGQAHRKHLYQLMANELHLPHVLVSLCYMLLQLVISLGMVYIPATALWHCGYLIGVLIVLAAFYLWFMKKHYHLHEEYLASLEKK